MDRSFLSDTAVIAASREFICVRLLSYENKEEAAFLKSFGATRSGEAENTLFCVLAPDGKYQLIKAARGPRHTFRNAAEMAEGLKRTAKGFPHKQAEQRALPLVANVRLAVNVAAADRQPLIVIQAADEATRKKLARAVGVLAWSPEYIGQFVYAEANVRKELDVIDGVAADAAVVVVSPDTYGLKGKVLAQIAADASPERLAEMLKAGLIRFQRAERNTWQHIQQGQQQGIFWETQTPVTDPMELRAREKGRKKSAPQE